MPTASESNCHKYLFPSDTARLNRIRLLVRQHGMNQFRQKCQQWADDREMCGKRHDTWHEARREHEAQVRREPRLRDEGQGRPKPGWEFDFYPGRPKCAETDRQDVLEAVEGWTPPHLLLREQRKYEPPLPIPDGPLTIAEKFAVVSAINDSRLIKGVDLIKPWRTQSPPEDEYEACRYSLASDAFDLLAQEARKILQSDAAALDAIVEDVIADLEEAPAGDASDRDREVVKASGTSLPGLSEANDDAHMSPAKLAEVFEISADPLRSRLRRWRAHNHKGWIENPDRAPREPKYVYRVGSVRHILRALQATSESTSERPAKQI